MKLQFLGTGSAFTVGTENYHSNILLSSSSGKKLLIDCGSDVRLSLHEQGYQYKDITDVYISHLHMDHAGGLEWLGFSSYFDPSCEKPTLHISKDQKNSLWKHMLSAGMMSIEGEEATLDTFFKVDAVSQSFKWENTTFELVKTLHVYNNKTPMPCYGLFIKHAKKNIFFTADTQFIPEKFSNHYKNADLIFHDCETNDSPSGVHASFKELCSLPAEIKKKIYLYHYNPGNLPDAIGHGFLGFVEKGQVFDF